ncbi:family 10 glycosylhydrolase [Trichothermofontia sichuanensis B231]|uniref:glycoside hydrolase family 10 protein n=1 Tax=Trichothermofontia sichuanensis TaxID=3045816 RepID=UPI002247B6EF|nr:glycoside hydrolase family 10 protein [Trichothermofontia sichuanensis]UZQ55725.1 family 10 glycosylhydrolase [Trichothermofontia sichuanensis B231]
MDVPLTLPGRRSLVHWRRTLGRACRRRLLSLLFVLSFCTTFLVTTPTPAITQLPRPEIRGVWITTNDAPVVRDRLRLQAAIQQLKQLNLNTIYPVVWNAGYAMYPSQVVQDRGIQSFTYLGVDGQDTLADLVEQGHQHGMLVIPWFEFGFMTPPSSELATKYAQWLTQKVDGGYTSMSAAGEVMWLNPFRPEVQQFITDLVLEIVTKYDVDGIQFDDHTCLPHEFGYDSYTLALYQRETGNAAPPPNNPAWVKWRADKITAFMVKLHAAVKANKPNVIFSVSPNYYDFAYKFHLQDWLAWIRQGAVDELVMQVYRPDLASFVEQISRPEVQEARQKIPTGIGILTGTRNNPIPLSQIQAQVRAVQERNLGVAFFYYESLLNYAPESVADRHSGLQALFLGSTQ